MPAFTITETVTYEVEAADEDEALAIFLDAPDLNAFFVAVEDRTIEEVPDDV